MRVVQTVTELRQSVQGLRVRRVDSEGPASGIGLVPTMGFLHEGHLSLVRRAHAENAAVVVSIFVNPLQFGPAEDFAAYPRDLDRDLAMLESHGVDLVFNPPVDEMYPRPPRVTLTVGPMSRMLCGAARPGHFDGVATVVAKLFGMVGPDRAYFGEKDFQQLAVIRRMVADLDMTVEVVGCPTVRESDGLAMSSRNSYLTAEERAGAPAIHRALRKVAAEFASGTSDAATLGCSVRAALEKEPLARLDYVAVVDPEIFEAASEARDGTVVAVACYFGRARLIDNVVLGRR
ncbi:MAG: pantoate--beta-alanine ligase [Actinomycetota bacterium]